MLMLGTILTVVVAALHAYFLYLEMFTWGTPRTNRIFGVSAEAAAVMKPLAANQGLYNGFLAAGLLFGALYWADPARLHIMLFFLACVVAAGIYGALTVKPSIFFVQAVPALLAMAALLAG
ncbi:MAG TPA: DUF1304 domain-containing protein [Alphaproteobacteria bacterium]|nr:DUF1304 domain-containing protein [Alphaproteobacteria bacterium]